MTGIEINFKNRKWDVNHIVDTEGPFFERAELSRSFLNDCRDFLSDNHASIEITYNEYLGNEEDGFDFNNCYARIECETVEELGKHLIVLLPYKSLEEVQS